MGLGIRVKIVSTENRVENSATESSNSDDSSLSGSSSSSSSSSILKSFSTKLKQKTAAGAYTLYELSVTSRSASWSVHRRFSEFHVLHQSLLKLYGAEELPKAPKKTLRLRQFDAVALAERRVALEEYLAQLLNSSVSESSTDLRKFLLLNDEGTGPSESADELSRVRSPLLSDGEEEEEVDEKEKEEEEEEEDGYHNGETGTVPAERPEMRPDSEVTECKTCQVRFSFLERKSHCRACGDVFCRKCTTKSIPLPQFGHATPVRVCDACFKTAEVEPAFKVVGSLKESINMRSCLESVFTGLTGDIHSVFISPKIPVDKWKNAKRSCSIPDEERPVVLLDNTKGKSGYSSVVFGVLGIHFSCATLPAAVGKGHFDYAQLFKQRLYAEDEKNLHVGPHKIINLSHVRLSAQDLIELLESLKSYVKSKELAAAALEKSKREGEGNETVRAGAGSSGNQEAGGAPPVKSNSAEATSVSRVEPFSFGADQLPGDEKSWQDLLTISFKGLGPSNSIYFHPHIPPQKLGNFRKKVTALGNDRTLLFLDNTKGGSGYQGAAFSITGIHFYADRLRVGSNGSGFLSWHELFGSVIQAESGDNVAVGHGKLINLSGSHLIPSQLVECLHLLSLNLQHRSGQGQEEIEEEDTAPKKKLLDVQPLTDDEEEDESDTNE